MNQLSIDVKKHPMAITSRMRSRSSYGPAPCAPTTSVRSRGGLHGPHPFKPPAGIGYTRNTGKRISNRRSSTGITFCLLAAFFCGSCGTGGSVIGGSMGAGLGGPMREPRCDTSDGDVTSLVVDWSASERTNLGAAAARGLVFVRVDECNMTILSRCSLSNGSYRYQSVPPKPQHETYRDEGALYTSMPFGVARLAGHLSGSSFLDLNMTMVGQYTSDRVDVAVGSLPSDCAGATHMISSYNVGAFELKAVDASSAGGSGSALGGEVGGDKTSHSGWSTRDGSLEACEAGGSDQSPAQMCSSPISITLVPLTRRGSTPIAHHEPRAVPSEPSTNPRRSGGSQGRTAIAISAGHNHTCGLHRSGGVECWGRNSYGQLGDGTKSNRLVPTPVADLGSGVSAIAADWSRTCALRARSVVCWGSNSMGELRDGSKVNRLVPTPVNTLGNRGTVSDVAQGISHACLLMESGAAWCWGSNDRGQLGDGSTLDSDSIVEVARLGRQVSAIAAGDLHTCALKSTGAVMCWGHNGSGQLGDGLRVDRRAATPVAGLAAGVSAIAAGNNHTCALKSTGAVVCWGSNENGELGDGTELGRRPVPTPVATLGSGVSAIAAGGFHTCALKSTGSVVCWGRNLFGELGDGSTVLRRVPAPVAGLGSGVSAITAGLLHTCALKSTGGVVCWGYNKDGQLGDGTTTDRLVPTPVVGYP